MKKVLLSTVVGLLSVAVVSADPFVPDEQSGGDGACTFEGAYVTAGVGGVFYKQEANSFFSPGPGSYLDMEQGLQALTCNNGEFSINRVPVRDSAEIKNLRDIYTGPHLSFRHGRLVGCLGLGYGTILTRCVYFGCEAMCDFGARGSDAVRLSAAAPSCSFRLGYYDRATASLYYVKVGASYVASELDPNSEAAVQVRYVTHEAPKVGGVQPAIALGAEHAFGRRFSGRLECEYRFPNKKTFHGLGVLTFESGRYEIDGTVRARSASGFALRALVVYHIQ